MATSEAFCAVSVIAASRSAGITRRFLMRADFNTGRVVLLFGENDTALPAAAVFSRVKGSQAFPLALRRMEGEYAAFDFVGQPFELRLAVDVGGGFEIEPFHAHKSVSHVDLDARVVNRRAFTVGDGEGDGARAGLAVHDRDLVWIRGLLGMGRNQGGCQYQDCGSSQGAHEL